MRPVTISGGVGNVRGSGSVPTLVARHDRTKRSRSQQRLAGSESVYTSTPSTRNTRTGCVEINLATYSNACVCPTPIIPQPRARAIYPHAQAVLNAGLSTPVRNFMEHSPYREKQLPLRPEASSHQR